VVVTALTGRSGARAGGADGRVAGASLTEIGSADASQAGAAFARLVTDGVNTVALNVWWQADSPTASTESGTLAKSCPRDSLVVATCYQYMRHRTCLL